MIKPKLHSGPGLVLAIPTLGRPVSLDWAFMFKSMNPPINFNVYFNIVKGKPVADARNDLAEYALKMDTQYLFFLGDDVLVPAHGLRQLIYRMEQDPELGVVGGVYCNKSDPAAPLVFRGNGKGSYWDWKVGEYFPVTGLGMDCTLIRTDVLEEISRPWFETIDRDEYLDGKSNCESWTEDLNFLAKVEKTKWKIYCDATIICGHEDVYNNRIYTLPPGSLPMRVKTTTKEKKCLVVGPPTEMDLSEFDVVRIGHDEKADYRGVPSSLPFETAQFDKVVVTLDSYYMPEVNRVAKEGAQIECLCQLQPSGK